MAFMPDASETTIETPERGTTMSLKGRNAAAERVVWDLNPLYGDEEDPRIDADLDEVMEKARSFASEYKGKVVELADDVGRLQHAILAYEEIQELGMRPYFFASLCRASDTQSHKKNALYERVTEAWQAILKVVLFFELEIKALPEEVLRRFAHETDLSGYSHFFFRTRELKPYVLSEPEERIIEEKKLSGRQALVSFFDEFMGSLSFPLGMEGGEAALTREQALALLYSSDHSVRERAFESLLLGLGRHASVFKYILNTLMLDTQLENRGRGYPSTMHRSHLEKEVDRATIETMLTAVEDAYPLARRYFRAKARALGSERLRNCDLLAPPGEAETHIPFSQARELILDAMEAVHPLFYQETAAFFEARRIDAEARKGKRDGAFCECFAPTQSPFILMSYTGNLRSLLILAHEIGHGIHSRLASGQTILNFRPSVLTAETASTFCENLLIHHLLEKESIRPLRRSLLASRVDGVITTAFRQTVMTRFEEAIHARRERHLLSAEEISDLWWAANEMLFGKDVEMMPAYRWGWTYIPHLVHHPFYCYSYVFGCLTSLVCFEEYRWRKEGWVEKFVDFLRAGSSRSPMDLALTMGWDQRQKTFWERGLRSVSEWVDAFEESVP
jgi:oligoendopeptidase F